MFLNLDSKRAPQSRANIEDEAALHRLEVSLASHNLLKYSRKTKS